MRSKDYRIADLHDYLKQSGLHTVLIDGRLTTIGASPVQIYFDDDGQIRLQGMLSKDYFILRTLIY